MFVFVVPSFTVDVKDGLMFVRCTCLVVLSVLGRFGMGLSAQVSVGHKLDKVFDSVVKGMVNSLFDS